MRMELVRLATQFTAVEATEAAQGEVLGRDHYEHGAVSGQG